MNFTTGQVLYHVYGQVCYRSISYGQQPWKDGAIEITANSDEVINCIVKPNYGHKQNFKLQRSAMGSLTLSGPNLLIDLKGCGLIRVKTCDDDNRAKLSQIKMFLQNFNNGKLKTRKNRPDVSFHLSPTGHLIQADNNYKTPNKELKLSPGTPIGRLMHDGTDEMDITDFEDNCAESLLFTDVTEEKELNKENVHHSSVYHRRIESGSSLFTRAREEMKSKKPAYTKSPSLAKSKLYGKSLTSALFPSKSKSLAKSSKSPSSDMSPSKFRRWLTSIDTPSSAYTPSSLKYSSSTLKTTSFYSRGKQMLQTSFLESVPRKPHPLKCPVKKSRLSDFFKGRQEKPKQYTSNLNQPKLKGFANLGNTCYMNAILQSLFSLHTFVNDVLNTDIYREVPRGSLYKAVCQLLNAKGKNRGNEEIQQKLLALKGAISSTATRFSGNLQHDAHEFLEQCLDQLKEDVLKLNQNSASLKDVENTRLLGQDELDEQNTPYPCAISQNFQFTVLHSIQCNKCKDVITKTETYNDISLDVPRPRKNSNLRISIQTALDQFFQPESLEYACECGCKEATVTHSLSKLPRVMILQLKRYSYVNSAQKLCRTIDIPAYVSLARHCTSESKLAYPSVQSLSKNVAGRKPEMMSPGPAECSDNLPRKRLSYETNGLDTNSGYKFKRQRLTDSYSDMEVIDLTSDKERKESNTNANDADSNCESKSVEQMSEEQQLAFAMEMSRKESSRKNKQRSRMTEEDELAIALEMSMHETTFTPISSSQRTPKSLTAEPSRKHLRFDGNSVNQNRDSGIGLSNLEQEVNAKGEKTLPNHVPSNDSGISMEGAEPLDRQKSPDLNYRDFADAITNEDRSPPKPSKEQTTLTNGTHNYKNDAPQNKEDEDKALQQALELSLQEFEKTSTNNGLHLDLDCVQTIQYTKEEEEELKKNYESGHMANSYKLISIVSHIGATQNVGHYISDAYDFKKSSWFTYNDSLVSQISAESVQELRKRNGYIFFYMNDQFCT
ncbi:ubiquitin carboxyl-terminal hydrolase 37-like isoform X2 [Antedon mediterranea]|uniref:ubiquitin carboxyl-terminal hydrolase 37-like isoform X2 n=1 Tax=Antedon mediterranea TaxID=105859 RepID=UPI003AF9DFE4